jgi:hypothetical protein
MRRVKRSRVSPRKPLLTAILDPATLTGRIEAKETFVAFYLLGRDQDERIRALE